MKKLLLWDLYAISSKKHLLTGVLLRGRIRKFGIEHNINIIVENSWDAPGELCFAVLSNQNISPIETFLKQLFDDIKITELTTNLPNPIPSKAQLNIEERYDI